MASPASATRTSERLVPVGAVVPASATASVGGSVGLLVSAAGTVGTNTSESSSSGSVWSESITARFWSGWASSSAPSATVTW